MGKNRKRNKNRNKKNNNGYNQTSLALSTKDTFSVLENNKKEEKKEEKKDNSKSTGFNYYSNYYSNRKNYDYKGLKNVTSYPDFVELCKPSQKELKNMLLEKLLFNGYTEVITGDGYLYAKGNVPVLLTAHMDTVHKENVKDFYEYYDEEEGKHIISSPQGIGGDDRCGVYMILEIIKTHKCSILFCEDEESGGIGSSKFCKTELINELSDLKYLIELDRANKNDAVFYDCENDDFTKFIEENTGHKEAIGSFSDISNLSPDCRVASVNLSCGYYNAHTTSEYVIVEEMLDTIDAVKKLLNVECEQFEYIEKVYYSQYNRYYGGNRKGAYDWYDDYDDYYYGNRNYRGCYGGYYDSIYNKQPKTEQKKEDEEKSLYIYIYPLHEDEFDTYVSNGKTEDEAFGRFFMDNPTLCFADVFDYEFFDEKVCESGWYKND